MTGQTRPISQSAIRTLCDVPNHHHHPPLVLLPEYTAYALAVMDCVAAQIRQQADCLIMTTDDEDPEGLSMDRVETKKTRFASTAAAVNT